MKIDLIRSSHSVGKNTWHLEWCTKYRYKMMQKFENRNIVAACIRQAAAKHGIEILALEVLHDHVHLVIELPLTMNGVKAVQLLKGYSAWMIFQVKEKFLLRYSKRHFWSRGYMARTVGIDEEKAIKYMMNQQVHHGVYFT